MFERVLPLGPFSLNLVVPFATTVLSPAALKPAQENVIVSQDMYDTCLALLSMLYYQLCWMLLITLALLFLMVVSLLVRP